MSFACAFIDGVFVETSDTYDNVDPSTGQLLGPVARSGHDEVSRAVAAARTALPSWRRETPQTRSAALHRLADLIASSRDALAMVECEDTGKPISQARADADVCARYFEFYARAIESYYGVSIPLRPDLHVYTRREPYGVTGHIVAWNYPMQLLARGVAPALATGNCCVVKPADETPRSALMIAELAVRAGLPDGALNVVPGLGPEAGALLAAHPDVDHLGFVGSNEVGILVATAAAARVAPVVLELGGKSAQLVFPDANLERAASAIAKGILQNAGQTCSAGSRLLVHADVHDELVSRVVQLMSAATIGPGPADRDVGPLISRAQQARVASYVDAAEGEILCGGFAPEPDGIVDGAYYAPTVIDGVAPTSRIAQEEVFGPVLVVTSFDDEDEAIALANGTDYALLGAVWTRDLARAHRIAADVDAGQLYVNAYGAGGGVELPFGGFRRSGYGREKGYEALDTYTATKTVVVHLA